MEWSKWQVIEKDTNGDPSPHRYEERRWTVNWGSKRKHWQFRCVSCKRFIGEQFVDFCKNPKCHVPILLELTGEQRGALSTL